jgi:hypothetical protein
MAFDVLATVWFPPFGFSEKRGLVLAGVAVELSFPSCIALRGRGAGVVSGHLFLHVRQ